MIPREFNKSTLGETLTNEDLYAFTTVPNVDF